MVIQVVRPIRLKLKHLTLGVCMIYTVMFGSGAKIIIIKVTTARQTMAARGYHLPLNIASCGAVLGKMSQDSAVPPVATGMRLITDPMLSASAWCAILNSSAPADSEFCVSIF